MKKLALREILTPSAANIVTESQNNATGGKDLFMSGIFIQGEVRNQNQRVYPVNEIRRAVECLTNRITEGHSVLGEMDHPDDLNINLDRVSHMIIEMNMNGQNGCGKLKMLPTPIGSICMTLLENGVKLGVSSRGSGDVDLNGNVSGYEIITVDIVANPSAPNAYPDPIYEKIMNHRRANSIWDVASNVRHDPSAQDYLKEEMIHFINDLGR